MHLGPAAGHASHNLQNTAVQSMCQAVAAAHQHIMPGPQAHASVDSRNMTTAFSLMI